LIVRHYVRAYICKKNSSAETGSNSKTCSDVEFQIVIQRWSYDGHMRITVFLSEPAQVFSRIIDYLNPIRYFELSPIKDLCTESNGTSR